MTIQTSAEAFDWRREAEQRHEFAKGLLAILQEQTAATAKLAEHATLAQAERLAEARRIEAEGRRAVEARLGAAAPKPVCGALTEEAIEILADRADAEGWADEGDAHIIEQFEAQIDGLLILHREFIDYCARKGLDPAEALPTLTLIEPSIRRIAAQAQPAATATTLPAPEPAAPARTREEAGSAGSPAVRAFFRRYLDLRCEGFALDRKHETPDPRSGASFRQNSRRNIESTVGLFVDLFGDLPVGDIDGRRCKAFVETLPRIPATWGKSKNETRPLRQVIEDTEAEERRELESLAARFRSEGLSPGEIEERRDAARVRRLRNDTCLRHMRDFARGLDFAILDGVRPDNPMRDHLWSSRAVKRRKDAEATPARRDWGDAINKLFASPIYREPLKEPGEPLFWAPLLGVFAGLRLEEALQLRTTDFDTEDGVPFVAVQLSTGQQRLKNDSSRRCVPLHSALIDLGLLELVERRKAAGQNRLFTYLERGKSKGKLGEIFSKRFTYYRKRSGIYDPRHDFHSLRHEFTTRLEGAGVPKKAQKALIGHTITDITDRHYNHFGAMRDLKEFVDRISIEWRGIRRPFEATAGAAS